MRPQAVTFDFHNTLARCDDWFLLEIRNLVPNFLRWHAVQDSSCIADDVLDRSVTLYRNLRLEIMDHGVEHDAATCLDIITRELGFDISPEVIEQGLRATMHETLASSTAIDGVVESVKALHDANVPLGVISSAVYHPFLEWSLAKFGILDAFDVVVTSASCGFYKSRTEIYAFTLDALSAAPGKTVHVGDSYRFDVQTASKIGMRTIWFDSDGGAPDEHQADAVVRTMVDVDKLILNGLMSEDR